MISKYSIRSIIFLCAFFSLQSLSHAKVNVVVTTPDIAWAVKKIGGGLVSVNSLLSGREDPHYVDAVPEFIRLVASADVVCQVGLDLEVGWLPKVLEKSGNAKVQSGGSGECILGSKVKALEVPSGPVDRSMGDTHPGGNPHFWLGPETFWEAASAILEVLSAVDPKNAATYYENYSKEKKTLLKIKADLAGKLSPFKNSKNPLFIQYHREFSYFFHEFSLNTFGAIEEKPGVLPSAGRIGFVGLKAKSAGVKLALVKPNDPSSVISKFSELSSVEVLRFNPSLVKGEKEDYYAHLNDLVELILKKLTYKEN